MRLFTAQQDFQERTLGALEGTLPRIFYVLGLRQPQNSFAHWGLQRTYGAEKADDAIRSAYQRLRREVLRTDLASLMAEDRLASPEILCNLNANDLEDAHLSLIFECLAAVRCGASRKAA